MMQQKSYIPTALGQANKNPAFNKEKRCSKDYYKTISILPHLSNFLKICFAKCLIIWIIFYPNTSAVSEKNKTYNIAF